MKPGRPPRLVVLLLAAALVAAPPSRAQDASLPEEVEITVGADGTSAIREVRSAQLGLGESTLRLFDVSPQMLPESVAMRALTGPELVELRQQTAWFEVLDLPRLLEKFGERPIKLFRYQPSEVETFEGRLLYPPFVPGPTGAVRLPLYLEENDGKIRLLDDAEIQVDALPQGDWNRFRLDWKLACRRADRYRLELVYLTRGFSWRADYLLRVAADGATGDLSAVATIDNATEMAWRGVRLAVAESDELVHWSRRAEPGERASALVHPLADGATIERGTAPQFSFGQARDVKLRSSAVFHVNRERPGERLPVLRQFELVDLASRGLSRALPAGTARVALVDGKNRPSMATRPFAGCSAGDTLTFAADPIPGVVAACDVSTLGPQQGLRVTVRFASERDDALEVETICPLEVAESVDSPSVAVDRSLRDRARFRLTLPAHGAAAFEFNLVRP